MVVIEYVRDPSQEEISNIPKWSNTTAKVLAVVKARGRITNNELRGITGYKAGTVNAQISILRRLGIVVNSPSKSKVHTPTITERQCAEFAEQSPSTTGSRFLETRSRQATKLETEKPRPIGQKNKEYMAEPIMDWILDGIPDPPQVKLFDDLGFIYEAQLAKMELSSWWSNPQEFVRRAAYYEEVDGQKTYHYYISDIKGKDQIGRTNQYLTHWYYPYKAKFHPQMIKALINWMGLKRGSLLLDPFVGSGTALIESKLIGINSLGIDIDPLCVLMSQVKTDLLDLTPEELRQVSLRIAFDFFHQKKPPSMTGLGKFLQVRVEDYDEGPFRAVDERIYNFYLLSYLYALSDWTYIKVDMWKQFNKNAHNMIKNIQKFNDLKHTLPFEFGTTKVIHGDARFLGDLGIKENSVDGVITSPPYSIAVDYIAMDLHAFQYLGIDPQGLQDKLVGLKGKGEERVRIYFEDMGKAFDSMFEVLKPQTYCSVVIGDVTYNGYKLPISETYIKLAKQSGFEYVGIIRRPILGGFARLRYEYLIIFRKP